MKVDYSYECELCRKGGLSQTGLVLHIMRVHHVKKEVVHTMFCYLFSNEELKAERLAEAAR